MEIRSDGKVIFEDLSDERICSIVDVKDDDILDFAQFLIDSGNDIEKFYTK